MNGKRNEKKSKRKSDNDMTSQINRQIETQTGILTTDTTEAHRGKKYMVCGAASEDSMEENVGWIERTRARERRS